MAFTTDDPDGLAAFYERILGARIVKAEGHPVMAYLGNTGLALHERNAVGPHTAVRVSEEERAEIKRAPRRGGHRVGGARPRHRGRPLLHRPGRTHDRSDHLPRRRRSAAPQRLTSSDSGRTAHVRCRVAAHAVDQQRVEAVRELVRVAPRLQPRVRPVRRREREQRGGRVVEVGAQLTQLAPLARRAPGRDPRSAAARRGSRRGARPRGSATRARTPSPRRAARPRRADARAGRGGSSPSRGSSSGIASSTPWNASAPSRIVS